MAVRIQHGGQTWELAGDHRFTFGRDTACVLCLDPADTGIPRWAGAVYQEQGTWWLQNTSNSRLLEVIDSTGLRRMLNHGERIPVEESYRAVVTGSPRGKEKGATHSLLVEPVGAATRKVSPPADGIPTAVGDEVTITADDRLALVALFAGYLKDPPHYDPHPRSYDAAGRRLGLPGSTVRKRVEYLRTRLADAGVPHVAGPDTLPGLAEYALSRGLISRADLRLLDG
jgi:hypothetical protein